jgi:acetyl-CoA/propionyl-CoA carboxylase biotin carboxyl carrier protein
MELRISAEDPARVFAPAPGRISRWVMPSGPGVRIDTALEVGDRVPPEYDPLICKLIVHAADRAEALGRLRRALDEIEIGGVQTTLPFHRAMLAEPGFAGATELSTTWVDSHWDGAASRASAVRAALLAAGLAELGATALDAPTAIPDPAVPGGSRRPATAAGGAGDVSAWRAAGRAGATDRWPT